MRWLYLFPICLLLFTACDKHDWNDPHKSANNDKNSFYSSFDEPPKTLDPARSYSANEALFIGQIYEPPLQYDFLKRPYTLEPLTAVKMPTVNYYDQEGDLLPESAPVNKIAESEYIIEIKPGIFYAPHPAFAKKSNNEFYYHHLSVKEIIDKHTLGDFAHTGTRELTAADYVYQIKRLAHPKLNSPILGMMENHIVGLAAYAKLLRQENAALTKKQGVHHFLDLRQYPLTGVEQLSRYSYRIRIKGIYPQFMYWLAMPFFAPIPWEADYFYSQPEMEENNLTFDWYPVGTGQYMLIENNPNKQMILAKNPNFRGEYYPLASALTGQPLPLVNQFVFTLEKESIPRWSKFLQGYYDRSAISSDSFDQAIHVDQQGELALTDKLKQKGMYLQTTISPAIYYYGFNMLDDVVGGYTERARKLRLAIAIALNQEEMIAIFLNGRGFAAHGPIPPGIFGNDESYNPEVYAKENDEVKRKPIQYAQQLLAEAGYPNGRDSVTGQPLIINYDVTLSSGPDDKALFDWMRKQFAKLGIELNIRAHIGIP